jgi:hypothetical protein
VWILFCRYLANTQHITAFLRALLGCACGVFCRVVAIGRVSRAVSKIGQPKGRGCFEEADELVFLALRSPFVEHQSHRCLGHRDSGSTAQSGRRCSAGRRLDLPRIADHGKLRSQRPS